MSQSTNESLMGDPRHDIGSIVRVEGEKFNFPVESGSGEDGG